jgi:hypothetical protein
VNWKGYIRPRAGIHKPEIGHFFGRAAAFPPEFPVDRGADHAATHKKGSDTSAVNRIARQTQLLNSGFAGKPNATRILEED